MSVLPDAISESLDYNNMKRRAVASRSYRVRIAPSNGAIFSPGSTINLDLPSNLAGTYVDFSQCYLRLKVAYTGTNASAAYLPKCGAYSFIQRLQCVTSGQSIYDLNNYNVLAACLLDTDASQEWRGNAGNVLAGTMGAVPRGEVINGTTTRTYCLPFVLHPLAMQKKLVPLFSLDSLRFRVMLETAANAMITPTNAADVNSYSISEAELVCYFTELSPSAQAQVHQMVGGVYNLLCPSYMNSQTTMAAATTAVTATLGVAVSSLERVIVVHRNTAAFVAANDSIGARISNNIQSVQFFINSEAYPMRPMNFEDAGSEILAEYLISDHALSDFSKASMIQTQINGSVGNLEAAFASAGPSPILNTANAWSQATTSGSAIKGDATTTVGSFLVSCELESGVSAGKSDRLYSGISTISSIVQYKGIYTASSVAAVIDFYAHFTVLLTLDMNRLGVWQISV
jgi:hypothetical protein